MRLRRRSRHPPVNDQADIVEYQPHHRPGLLRLWRMYFGPWAAERLDRMWAWQFDANPFTARRPAKILIGVCRDEVVGHIAGFPLPFLLDGQPITPLFCANLVADDRHRWLGFRLVRAMAAEPPLIATSMSPAALGLVTRCGAPLVEFSREQLGLRRSYAGGMAIRIRNRLSPALGSPFHPGWLRRIAPWYTPKGSPPRQPLPRAPVPSGAEIRPIDRFGPDAAQLWAGASAAFNRTLDRTPAYLNWRYVDCPTCHPIRLGLYENNSLTGIAVGIVRAGHDRFYRPCAYYGDIAEFIAREPLSHQAEALLVALMHALDRRRVDAITTSALSTAARPLLLRLGFVPHTCNDIAMAVQFPDGHDRYQTNPRAESWYFTTGDGDALYSSGL